MVEQEGFKKDVLNIAINDFYHFIFWKVHNRGFSVIVI
jgi:hypothetical protein